MKFARIIELGDDQILIQKRYGEEDFRYNIVISIEYNGLLYDVNIENLPEDKADNMFNNLTLEEVFEITKNIGIKIK